MRAVILRQLQDLQHLNPYTRFLQIPQDHSQNCLGPANKLHFGSTNTQNKNETIHDHHIFSHPQKLILDEGMVNSEIKLRKKKER